MVSGSLSNMRDRGSEQEDDASPPFTYAERFHQAFPQYLAIGMTSAEYWDGDCTLVVEYRKAEEIRNNKKNQELWLQGMYIYEALCDVAPVMRAFAKKGTKPHKYPAEPYALTDKERKKSNEKQERKVFNKGLAVMEALTKSMNQKFQQQALSDAGKEVSDHADNG